MGLDMYLEARVSASKPYGSEESANRLVLEEAATKVGLPPSDNIDFITISREVVYWRKANQVHAWFVKNVQNGNDDCGHYYVSREQLAELRDTCQRVIDGSSLVDGEVTTGWTYEDGQRVPMTEAGKIIADPALAKELLPAQSGFFFGGTDYDEWYLRDLENTVAQIDKVLATVNDQAEFYYHSSW